MAAKATKKRKRGRTREDEGFDVSVSLDEGAPQTATLTRRATTTVDLSFDNHTVTVACDGPKAASTKRGPKAARKKR